MDGDYCYTHTVEVDRQPMLQWMETATHTQLRWIDSQCYNGWRLLLHTHTVEVDRQPMLQWMETTATHTQLRWIDSQCYNGWGLLLCYTHAAI